MSIFQSINRSIKRFYFNNHEEDSIFFSYKSDDVSFVRPICEQLRAHGRSVWFDEYDLSFDQKKEFQKIIDRAIDKSKWGAIFASDHHAGSKYCRDEVIGLLQRLPINNIFVFQISQANDFFALFPELLKKRTIVSNAKMVFDVLHKEGVVSKRIEPITSYKQNIWWLNEIAAYFNAGPWHIDADSIWPARPPLFDLEGNILNSRDMLVADLCNQTVRLFVDCHRLPLNEKSCDSLKRRTTDLQGKVCFEPDNFDDRIRLLEEFEYFEYEVKKVRESMAPRYSDLESFTFKQDLNYQAIGAHIFETKESEGDLINIYKHRSFSYQHAGRLYRDYKLCLPHPQLFNPVTVRFVFEFCNDLNKFFRIVSLCDEIVRSFSWITLTIKPTLNRKDIEAAIKRRKGNLPCN